MEPGTCQVWWPRGPSRPAFLSFEKIEALEVVDRGFTLGEVVSRYDAPPPAPSSSAPAAAAAAAAPPPPPGELGSVCGASVTADVVRVGSDGGLIPATLSPGVSGARLTPPHPFRRGAYGILDCGDAGTALVRVLECFEDLLVAPPSPAPRGGGVPTTFGIIADADEEELLTPQQLDDAVDGDFPFHLFQHIAPHHPPNAGPHPLAAIDWICGSPPRPAAPHARGRRGRRRPAAAAVEEVVVWGVIPVAVTCALLTATRAIVDRLFDGLQAAPFHPRVVKVHPSCVRVFDAHWHSRLQLAAVMFMRDEPASAPPPADLCGPPFGACDGDTFDHCVSHAVAARRAAHYRQILPQVRAFAAAALTRVVAVQRTRTHVTVRWQSGTVEPNVLATSLHLKVHLQDFDILPGDFVVPADAAAAGAAAHEPPAGNDGDDNDEPAPPPPPPAGGGAAAEAGEAAPFSLLPGKIGCVVRSYPDRTADVAWVSVANPPPPPSGRGGGGGDAAATPAAAFCVPLPTPGPVELERGVPTFDLAVDPSWDIRVGDVVLRLRSTPSEPPTPAGISAALAAFLPRATGGGGGAAGGAPAEAGGGGGGGGLTQMLRHLFGLFRGGGGGGGAVAVGGDMPQHHVGGVRSTGTGTCAACRRPCTADRPDPPADIPLLPPPPPPDPGRAPSGGGDGAEAAGDGVSATSYAFAFDCCHPHHHHGGGGGDPHGGEHSHRAQLFPVHGAGEVVALGDPDGLVRVRWAGSGTVSATHLAELFFPMTVDGEGLYADDDDGGGGDDGDDGDDGDGDGDDSWQTDSGGGSGGDDDDDGRNHNASSSSSSASASGSGSSSRSVSPPPPPRRRAAGRRGGGGGRGGASGGGGGGGGGGGEEWACDRCTLLNAPSHRRCDACGSPRPPPGDRRKPATGGGAGGGGGDSDTGSASSGSSSPSPASHPAPAGPPADLPAPGGDATPTPAAGAGADGPAAQAGGDADAAADAPAAGAAAPVARGEVEWLPSYASHRLAADEAVPARATAPFLQRVGRELSMLEALPAGVTVRASEGAAHLLKAAVIGAAGTPYHRAALFFDILLPEGFPQVAPRMYHHAYGVRLNPNLYADGFVCLSLLGTWDGHAACERWVPFTSSVLQLLVSIHGMVLGEEPYYNEAGYHDHVGSSEGAANSRAYNEGVMLGKIRHMISVAAAPPPDWGDFVRAHVASVGPALAEAAAAACAHSDAGTAPPPPPGARPDAAAGPDADGLWHPVSRGVAASLRKLLPRLHAAIRACGGVPPALPPPPPAASAAAAAAAEAAAAASAPAAAASAAAAAAAGASAAAASGAVAAAAASEAAAAPAPEEEAEEN